MSVSGSDILTIDGHTDISIARGEYTFPLEAAIAGGVNAAVVPARVARIPIAQDPESAAVELERTLAAIERTVAESDGRAAIATSPAQLRANAAEGVFSFIIGFQNARPLLSLDALASWLDRGVSVVDLGFAGSNQWVESSRPYPTSSVTVDFDGVSALGEQAIALLNERGVIIDTAQVSERARDRILELSTAPVIASHNGLRAKVGTADRTIGDDQIRAIAASGGLVQIVAFDGYLSARGDDPRVVADIRELRERFGLPGYRGPSDYYAVLDPETAEWDEATFDEFFREYHVRVRHGWPKSDVATLVDAVDHVVQLVGIDHVGIASDFHHGGGVGGWLNASDTPNVTAALRERFAEEEVAKIWGGNFLRAWSAVRGD